MSKKTLWLLAAAILIAMIGGGVTYYFLVDKPDNRRLSAISTNPSPSLYQILSVYPPGVSPTPILPPDEDKLSAQILILNDEIAKKKERLRAGHKDEISILKNLIAQYEAALEWKKEKLEQLRKAREAKK
jgi:hypothetical protein